tara:strand:- start:1514 stop:1900 length:387 start_codon:yes stop_codon:yes gene_type:complete
MLITEIAKKLNITTRTIRHYEEIGVIKSNRLENNYRYFNAENINKLKFLVRARNLGFSLEECKELIKLFDNSNRKSVNVRDIAKNKLIKLSEKIKELEDLKKSLEWLVSKCPGNSKPECPILDELARE